MKNPARFDSPDDSLAFPGQTRVGNRRRRGPSAHWIFRDLSGDPPRVIALRYASLPLALLAAGLLTAAPDRPSASGTWVDLTHAFGPETLYWPTEETFELETRFQGFTPAGYFYVARAYRAPEHGGTHLDAPLHFAQDRRTVDQIPLDQLTGQAVVVSVTDAVRADRDYEVTVDDFRRWEWRHGRIRPGRIVLIHTGFGAFWPDAVRYLGTAAKGPEAVKELHFPGLHPDAARWLVKERRIKAVGLDTASIDHGPSRLFEAHRALFEHNVPAFENVANLDRLPPKGAYVVALPMKILNGSGAPLRIIAQLP